MKNLILVDFSWLYNRYYYVAKYNNSSTNDNVSSTVLVMLKQFFFHLEAGYPNTNIMIALDAPTSTLNNFKVCSDYKQNRNRIEKKEVYKDLDSILKKLIKTLNPKNFYFTKAKSYEADQIIASLVKRYHDKCKIIVFSGDKDLLQLTYYKNIRVSDKFKDGKFILKTDKEIFEKFKNNQGEDFTRISENKRDILKYRVLKGDSSDNLSAVFPRIRDKEISEIIKNYWIDEEELTEKRIDDILDNLKCDNSQLANKLEANKEVWLRNWKIMNLLDIEEFDIKRIK